MSLNIEHDLFVSSVLDEVVSDRDISGVSMCVLGGANSWLSMVPGLRFGSESKHKKFINQRAGLFGSNSVDVKVGGDFAQISADIECHDADQKNISVVGERKVSELDEADEKKLSVISTEFLSNISGILNDYNQISEVYNSIKTRAINSNKSEKEAEIEAEKFKEDAAELIEKIIEEEDKQNLIDAEKSEQTPILENDLAEIEIAKFWADIASDEVDPKLKLENHAAKTKTENFIKNVTLLRYKIERFIVEHPEAAEWCSKVFEGAVRALQGVEYVGSFLAAGPVGVAGKYATQEAMSAAIETTIDTASKSSAQALTADLMLQNEYAKTIKCLSYAGLCAGTFKASKSLINTLKENAKNARSIEFKVDKISNFEWNPTLGKTGSGIVFENHLAELPEFKGMRLPINFKTFDFWRKDGLAISAKTLNTNSKTYVENPSAIFGKLKRYVDKTLEFTVYGKGLKSGKPITAAEIKQRVIQLGVPENISDTAIKQLQRAIDYGNLNSVEIIIRKIK